MAKKNKKIQDQLEQGLKNAEQVVDVQLEGKLAPREPIKAKSWGGWKTPEQTPAAVAPSAPAAGAQPAAQNLAQFEDEITKVINESQYFKRKYDELRYLIESGEPQNVVADATTALAETISRSTGGQLPQEEVASFLENKIAAKKAPAPVMAEGGVQVPPSGETRLSVAPTPISSEILPGVQTPEKTATASTLDPSILSRLRAADAAVAADRPGFDPDEKEARLFGGYTKAEADLAAMTPEEQQAVKVRTAPSKGTAERLRKQAEGERASLQGETTPDFVKANLEKKIRSRRKNTLLYESLSPIDDLYALFDYYFGSGESGDIIRDMKARDREDDPENRRRGKLAMRQNLFHYGLGYLSEDLANSRAVRNFRKDFDMIMAKLGIDQSLINQVREYTQAKRRTKVNGEYQQDVFQPWFGDQEPRNIEVVKDFIGEISVLLDKLGQSGALKNPENAKAIYALLRHIHDIDADLLNDSYLKFNPVKEVSDPDRVYIDRLKNLPSDVLERVIERTGVDLSSDVETEDGPVRRSSMSPLTSDSGASFTGQNVVRYQTSSRRRYALDRAGLIDGRWQEVDAKGVDAPSFINELHPDEGSTRAAIGFLITTDPTTDVHARAGGKGKRDGRLEGVILRELKSAMAATDFVDDSESWPDNKELKMDSDIAVGKNIEYTTDSSVVDSEVEARRSMLPKERFVIIKLNSDDFPQGSRLSLNEQSSMIIGNDYGIIVVPEDSAFVDAARKQGATTTAPFVVGDEIDISKIVPKGTFGTLKIDIDPHVLPAVKHTLPLRSPMGRQSTAAMIPESFAEEGRKSLTMFTSSGAKMTVYTDGSYNGNPAVNVRTVDRTPAPRDGRVGVLIVGTSDGRFPEVGSLIDYHLPDQDSPASRRRWRLGDIEEATTMFESGERVPGLGAVSQSEMREGLSLMATREREEAAGVDARKATPITPAQEDIIGKVRARMSDSTYTDAQYVSHVQLKALDEGFNYLDALGQKAALPAYRVGVYDRALARILGAIDHGAFSATTIDGYKEKLSMFLSDLLLRTASTEIGGKGPLGILSPAGSDDPMAMSLESGALSLKAADSSPGKSSKPSMLEAFGMDRTGLFDVSHTLQPIQGASPMRTHRNRTPYTLDLVTMVRNQDPEIRAMLNGIVNSEEFKEKLKKAIEIIEKTDPTTIDGDNLRKLARIRLNLQKGGDYSTTLEGNQLLTIAVRMALAESIIEMLPQEEGMYHVDQPGMFRTVRITEKSRMPYEAGEIYAESPYPYEVSQRNAEDLRLQSKVVEVPEDPILEESITSQETMDDGPISEADKLAVRKLKGRLLFILATRATKAAFDRANNNRNPSGRSDDIQVIRDTAPSIAALYEYAGRIGVVSAAIDAMIAGIPERMPEISPDDAFLLQGRDLFGEAAKIVRTELSTPIQFTSTGGLSMSRNAMQFATAQDLGVTVLNREDEIAFKFADELYRKEVLARKRGSSTRSIERMGAQEKMLAEEQDRMAGRLTSSLDLAAEEISPEMLGYLEMARDNPDMFSVVEERVAGEGKKVKLSPEMERLKKELKGARDPRFRSLLIELLYAKGNISAVRDAAYPDDFAKSVLQDDKQKPEADRRFKPRSDSDSISRGLLKDGTRDEYDTEMQKKWIKYVEENIENAGKKIGKVFGKVMSAPEGSYAVDESGTVTSAEPFAKIETIQSSELAGKTSEQIRKIATKAYLYYSMMTAFDQAGDNWVKFVNRVLYANSIDDEITNDWVSTGGKAISVPSSAYSNQNGEVPVLTTQDGSKVGILSPRWVKRIGESIFGSKLVDWAKANGLSFVLMSESLRDEKGNVRRDQNGNVIMSQQVYVAKATVDKKTGKLLEFGTLDELTFQHGYQPLATETSFEQTKERLDAMIRQHGADRMFVIREVSPGSGRYVAEVRSELLTDYFGSKYTSKLIESLEKKRASTGNYDDDYRKVVKLLLDSMVKFKFMEMVNKMATDAGLEAPYPDLTLESVIAENKDIALGGETKGEARMLNSIGETTGPFGIRSAQAAGNPHLPVLGGTIGRVVTQFTEPDTSRLDTSGEAAVDEDIRKFLLDVAMEPSVKEMVESDPMLEDEIKTGSIRSQEIIDQLTKGRSTSPEGSRLRVESDEVLALAKRALALQKLGKLNHVLNSGTSRVTGSTIERALMSRKGGFLAGAALIPFTASQFGKPTEEEVKMGLAFEALGAISPTVSSAAALGFTAMNRGDMLRTLVNILGGVGGSMIGATAGSLALPVGGTFAGGMAGSVAGSAIADSLYTAVGGGRMSPPPQNIGSVTTRQPAKEEDPFDILRSSGG